MQSCFEVHAVLVMEKVEMNLMQLKQSVDLEDGFYCQLRDFFVSYLQKAEENNMIHGDIKPRVALKIYFSQSKMFPFHKDDCYEPVRKLGSALQWLSFKNI